MSLNRRMFLKKLGTTIGAVSLGNVLMSSLASGRSIFDERQDPPSPYLKDEDFWGMGAGILVPYRLILSTLTTGE